MNFEVSPPEEVLWLWRTLEEAGFETWIVGGAIRDIMLGRPADDWDFATRARPKQIVDAFRRTVPIGVDHGTVGVLAPDGTLFEVTTFRRDVETFGRRTVVEFADSIEEDLSRRDFTLNALAWHPGRDQFLDPWEGATDLSEGILRTVGDPAERFTEDLLRVLRALRFAGQFGLTIEAETWRALLSAVPKLGQLSAERIQEEMMKVLSQGKSPSTALGLYAESGVFTELYPELDLGVPIAHALLACDAVPRTRPLVRLSLLFVLASTAEGQAKVHAEDTTGDVRDMTSDAEDTTLDTRDTIRDARRREIERLMERLRFSNADTKRVATVASSLFPAPQSEEPAGLRRWLSRVGPDHFTDIARAWLAGAHVQEESDRESVIRRVNSLRAILREGPPLMIGDLALDGSDLKDLGLPPGPQFGEILRFLLEEVLDRPEANNRADLKALVLQGGFFSTPRQIQSRSVEGTFLPS
jgi:tRNA nucleotidyltransferase (CCA-adding enzyme)